MQGIMDLGILTMPATEKNVSPELPKTGSSFSDALEKASETTDQSSRAAEKGNSRASAPENGKAADQTEKTEDTEDTEHTEHTEETEAEQPAEMLTMDLLFGTNLSQSPVADAPAAEAPVEAISPDAALQPAEMPDISVTEELTAAGAAEITESAETVEAAEIAESAEIKTAAETERPDTADFVKNIRERLEQELTETEETLQEPTAATVSGTETAERRGAETRSGTSDDFSDLLGSRGSETDADAVPELQTVQTFANAARFTAEKLIAKLEPTEIAQAIGKAIDGLASDLQSIDISPAEITIALDPEELGSISITISSDENHLTAKIVTDNKEAADLIAAQMDHYLLTMQEKGVQVEKAEVIYSRLDQDGHSGNGQGREPRRERPGVFRIEGIDGADGAGRTEDAEPEAPAAGTTARGAQENGADYAAEDVSVPGYRI